ncbi:MAG TPA: DUF1345 domain-containing protein [Stellaceae bacterium]|nr:DUF1345 domain-containing protein [Stellaceae bacterium]
MKSAPPQAKRRNFFRRQLDARPRLYLAIALGIAVVLLIPASMAAMLRILIGWDVGILFYLVAAGIMMVQATPAMMRQRAKRQDEGRWVILALMAAAACFSMVAIAMILGGPKDAPPAEMHLHLALAGLTVLCSWFFVHTMFAMHYAHDFYGALRSPKAPTNGAAKALRGDAISGGLEFPSEPAPDYLDFLYFSFVVGMTCQVSDVQISSRVLRRLALAHGILAFFFNTVILAFSVNIAASLL